MGCETLRNNGDEKVLRRSGVKWLISQIIDIISGIFLPLVNVMSAVGILKGLIAISVTVGLLSQLSGTYQILYSIADGFFYFLPVFLAYTFAKK
ncbi:phosphotransferase system glucose/maltose/N-acetylglucosamine-specific IIC component [Clostridium tetanomorphum]|uniref:hypothetical protein n=1 Tax=Clostridium tetanomorphum TaxID=1553 RepID=UPI00044DEEAA|nr:hypothetical protein [Clostridium tetanomorphum]KAJ51417.1 trehalose PTS trehalose component IIBC [Clostridium tetanomorphum DSM 665]MBP1866565.1 phosphotransferase system glucose/maltose/N-acetylglucosamine-specific IIC component [Clostridium tetanomorphum]NRS85346.1 phosphotransferase system glucose/maltose/N-acetylglucosamine-specific IIC component [Clostridium tetanomorphum]NRZ98525.1 phosphotransferase system glucose/maltose/N-acetylglucosamine-specific IIC component [Clostridium tetano